MRGPHSARGAPRRFRATINFKVEPNIHHKIEYAAAIPMELLDSGSKPVNMPCPFCNKCMTTKAHYKNSSFTHSVALFLGIFFWWLCCCIIPYVTKRWKNVEHYCPNCERFLGLYSRRPMSL